MVALRIGILAVDGVTLGEVTPAREQLEAMGAQVTVIVPSGGSILPITGRYFPAAGGHGARRSISQVTPDDYDLLLLPDSITGERLVRYAQLLAFVRVTPGGSSLPVFHISYLLTLLEEGAELDGLAREGMYAQAGKAA